MSCIKCDLHKNGFKTEEEFSKFDILVSNYVQKGQMVELGKKINTRFLEVRYKCSTCKAVWVLSFPDQAYRGGWYEE